MLPANALDITKDYVVPAEGSTENLVVKSGSNVTITLNGNLTVTGAHAISVESGATLTINGSGTVEAIGYHVAPLYNNGNTTLNGGTYYKDESKGTYYSIQNEKDMVINDGVVVKMDNTKVSSLVENGGQADGAKNLTINGGTFTGGVDSVKNDGEGVLTINGGSFTNTINTPIYNYHILTINGGSFTMPGNGNLNAAIYTNAFDPAKYSAGIVKITGGTFNAPALFTTDDYNPIGNRQPNPPVEIIGGSFNVDAFVSDNFVGNEEAFKNAEITGGEFTTADVAPADGYTKYAVGDDKYVVAETIDFDTTDATLDDMTVGGSFNIADLDLPELVKQYGVFTADGDVLTVDNGVVVANKAGNGTLTVAFDGKTKTYAVTVEELPELTPPTTTTEENNEETEIAAPNTGAKVVGLFAVVMGAVVAIATALRAAANATGRR